MDFLEDEKLISTNIGDVPLCDYLEIVAQQNGFESYEEMRKMGYSVDV